MRRTVTAALPLIGLLHGSPALAAETISYSYDPRGRLVQVQRGGTINNGVRTIYAFDKVDNRTSVTGTGRTFLVVFLDSFPVIVPR